jgi:hypothetical protein
MSKLLSLLVECTDHRVVTILRGLRDRRPPKPSLSHGMVGAMTRDRASPISVVAVSQMSVVFLRSADRTSMEAPFRSGILIGVHHWEAGSKGTWDLLGTEVVPRVVGFAKVAVWHTWLHGMIE